MRRSSRAELCIERLSKLGDGVGSYAGRTVFVRGALPGERVVAEVDTVGRVHRGALVQVLSASADRRPPACPLAEVCGGCDWLHLTEEAQRAAKLEILLSALEHLAQIPKSSLEVRPVLVSPRPMGYRRRAVMHFAHGELGFFGHKSHLAVPVPRCPALVPALADLPGRLSPLLRPIAKDAEAVHLLGEGDEVALAVVLRGPAKPRHVEACERAVREIAASGAVLVPKGAAPRIIGRPVLRGSSPLLPEVPLYLRPDVFAQANAEANVGLVASAVYELGAKDADRVLELCAGSGNFTFPVAATCRELWAVESSLPAVELAQRSAREGGAQNLRFINGEVRKVCKGLIAERQRFDLLLADPPRAGVPGIGEVARCLQVRRVVYVACDPAALARDARELQGSGFEPRALQAVDMFPQTHHVEAIMRFDRTG